jgi:hypothetical protein
MKTKQPLPAAIKTICKHDLASYSKAVQTIQKYDGEPIRDEYGKRCQKVVKSIDILKDGYDDYTQDVLDLVFLRRDAVSVEAAADILGVGKTSIYHVINEIMIDYATKMGYVQAKQRKKKEGGKEEWVS